ncbi:MAG: gamma-glutamyltransferase [Maricaulaceae bacterium]
MKTLLRSVALGGLAMLMPGAVFAQVDLQQPGDRVSGDFFATRSPVIAQNGMAATAHPLASQIAIDVLKAGGNAVDAAIAANAALGLMEPTGCGIGGDVFAIVWDPQTKKLYGLNGSGRSPQGMSLEDLKARLGERDQIPPFSSLAVSVPGAVDGWFALHERFGSTAMADILAPAIRYAEDGFPMTQTIARYWSGNVRRLQRAYEEGELEEFDNALATYFPDGAPIAEGELFKNPDLAATYRTLAEEGRDAFYKGEIAQTIDAYMKRIGGPLRYKDFADHHSDWVEPVSVNYRGYDVWELPPNTQGIAALQMLAILEDYDLAAEPPMSAQSLHWQIEAKRLAFEDRAQYYADPEFANVPLDGLVSKDYAAQRRALIDDDTARQTVGPGDPPALEAGDTTYLTVADKDGMMVSLIQSNYRGMGSGLVPDGLGFMLQDRGQLFALDPEHANVYAPGKRPFHTIIPAFVTKDDEPYLSFGLMGGGMQPQGHVQVLVNLIDHGMNVQEAGDAARWRHEGTAEPDGAPSRGRGYVALESGFPIKTRAALAARGHVLRGSDGGFGGYQAILRDPETGLYHGASEMRKDGAAIGY